MRWQHSGSCRRRRLWLAAMVLGGWIALQVLRPANPDESLKSIEDYCIAAKDTQVNSEADANSLASRYGLSPQRSVDEHNRVNIVIMRPAMLGADVSCRIVFDGTKVDIRYSEPGGLAGVFFRLAR